MMPNICFTVEDLDEEGEYYWNLLTNVGANITIEVDQIFVTYKGVKVQITTNQELFIFHEVFVSKIYNFVFPHDCVVIDVGMNVGFASLFFASMPHVLEVVGYEPFPSTYLLAKRNFSRNPELQKKMQPLCLGLSDRKFEGGMAYNTKLRGSNRIVNDPNISSNQEVIHINKASDTLKFYVEAYQNGNTGLVLKVDAEGSELSIVQDLYDAGYLDAFDLCMIEYHDEYPGKMIDLFLKNSMRVLPVFDDPEHKVGMLYAF